MPPIETVAHLKQALEGHRFMGISNRHILFVTWPDGTRDHYYGCSGGITEAASHAARLGLPHSCGYAA